jgi:hypothetical protein
LCMKLFVAEVCAVVRGEERDGWLMIRIYD